MSNVYTLLFSMLISRFFLVAQHCTKNVFYFNHVLGTCSLDDYCLASDQERLHTKFFSTKNAYQARQSHDGQNDFSLDNCIPSKIWLLIRHGTRLPTAKGISRFSGMEKFRDEIVENVAKLQKLPLCPKDWEILRHWKWNYSITEDQANHLVTQGYKELSAIAQNFKRYLPNLFQRPYDAKKFHFRHTNTERTRSSFRSFVDELFGEFSYTNIDAEIPPNQPDMLLKGYANCPLWRDQKKKLKQQPDSEVNKFVNSDVFLKLLADVDSRFGFNGTLTVERVEDIFNLCRYEQAWQTDKISIWCSLLTPSQVRVIEYQEDLNYYYKSSHGSKLNKNVKCFAMDNMLAHLSTNDEPKTIVYFSHSAAVQLFLTSLGAFRDEVDFNANSFSKMNTRKWQTSKISPFAANVAVLRFMCPNDDKVKFFLNERVIYFDWCTEDGVCNWDNVKEKYAFYANKNCDRIFCRDEL